MDIQTQETHAQFKAVPLSGGDILWHPANVRKAQGHGVRAPNIKIEYLSHRYREHYLTSIPAIPIVEFAAPLSSTILNHHCVQRFGGPLNLLRGHFPVTIAHSTLIGHRVKILPT